MKNLPAKLVTAFAIGAVLSFGLCAAGFDEAFAGTRGWIGLAGSTGFYGFFVCVVGLIASALWWAIRAGRSDDE